MNDYSQTPLVELLNVMTKLEQEINIKLMIYEEMRKEVCNRWPIIEQEDSFKEKVLVIKKNKE